jgi:hypothetical protein
VGEGQGRDVEGDHAVSSVEDGLRGNIVTRLNLAKGDIQVHDILIYYKIRTYPKGGRLGDDHELLRRDGR